MVENCGVLVLKLRRLLQDRLRLLVLAPLVMNEAEAREVLNRLVPLIKAFLEKRAAA